MKEWSFEMKEWSFEMKGWSCSLYIRMVGSAIMRRMSKAEEHAGPRFLVAFQFPPLQVGQHSIFVTLRVLAYIVPVTHKVWYPVPVLLKDPC